MPELIFETKNSPQRLKIYNLKPEASKALLTRRSLELVRKQVSIQQLTNERGHVALGVSNEGAFNLGVFAQNLGAKSYMNIEGNLFEASDLLILIKSKKVKISFALDHITKERFLKNPDILDNPYRTT